MNLKQEQRAKNKKFKDNQMEKLFIYFKNEFFKYFFVLYKPSYE